MKCCTCQILDPMPQVICMWGSFSRRFHFCTQTWNIPPEYSSFEPSNIENSGIWNSDFFMLRAVYSKLITYSNSTCNLGPTPRNLRTLNSSTSEYTAKRKFRIFGFLTFAYSNPNPNIPTEYSESESRNGIFTKNHPIYI